MNRIKNYINLKETRITVLLLLLMMSTITVSAQTNNMSIPIKLQMKNCTRQKAIEEIEKQTNYKLVYNTRAFDDKQTVDFGETRPTVGKLLEKMLAGTYHNYKSDGNYIVIYKMTEVAADSQASDVAGCKLSGTVTSAGTGLPQKGATIEVVDAYGKRATCNAYGKFSIEGLSPGSHIVKLTSTDGTVVRYSEIVIPVNGDCKVALTVFDKIMVETKANDTLSIPKAESVAYFIPGGQIVKPSSSEAKSQYTFIPSGHIGKSYLPNTSVKTNLLVWGAVTPNVGMEFGLAPKWSVEVFAGYNPFKLSSNGVNRFWFIQPEARYWFCQRFEKHFMGIHALYGQYNIGDIKIPFTDRFEEYRYDGWAAGMGVSYGYHLPMSKRWAWEFTIGAGYVYLKYDKFRCFDCDEYRGNKSRHYLGPTKAGISLIYMIK